MKLGEFISGMISSPGESSTDFQIEPQNIDKGAMLQKPFEANRHYFLVQINEMFLSEKIRWFKQFNPLVYTTTAFNYGKAQLETPFIVGPTLLGDQIKEIAKEKIFRDTTIAGWHPYSGGKVVLTLLLCKYETDDYLVRTFKAIEKISGLFNPGMISVLGSVLNISKTIVGGVNELVDAKGINGLACFRTEFDANTVNGFYPGYFVITDQSIPEEEKKKFYVIKNRLFYGDDIKTAKPYRENNYVLFSIEQNEKRDDYKNFSFYEMYEQAQKLASSRPMDKYKVAGIQSQLAALNLAMAQSPDLTRKNANDLMKDFYADVKELKGNEYKLGNVPANEQPIAEWMEMAQKITEL